MRTVVIAGKVFEDAEALKNRLGFKEMTLWRSYAERGMPKPIKLGRNRYFDREAVDAWVLGQTTIGTE